LDLEEQEAALAMTVAAVIAAATVTAALRRSSEAQGGEQIPPALHPDYAVFAEVLEGFAATATAHAEARGKAQSLDCPQAALQQERQQQGGQHSVLNRSGDVKQRLLKSIGALLDLWPPRGGAAASGLDEPLRTQVQEGSKIWQHYTINIPCMSQSSALRTPTLRT